MTIEPWRDLRPGDRVRFVRIPDEFVAPGSSLHPETLAVYEALVAARAVLTIDEMDDYGRPWTEGFEIDEDGSIRPSGIGHSLALDDDSWERA